MRKWPDVKRGCSTLLALLEGRNLADSTASRPDEKEVGGVQIEQPEIPQWTSSRRYRSLSTDYEEDRGSGQVKKNSRFTTRRDSPLTTFPRAVFLKNLRWVVTASVLGRLRMVISTMVVRLEF